MGVIINENFLKKQHEDLERGFNARHAGTNESASNSRNNIGNVASPINFTIDEDKITSTIYNVDVESELFSLISAQHMFERRLAELKFMEIIQECDEEVFPFQSQMLPEELLIFLSQKSPEELLPYLKRSLEEELSTHNAANNDPIMVPLSALDAHHDKVD